MDLKTLKVKTREKLQNQKIGIIEMDYQSFDEIDQKFRQFSDIEQKKYSLDYKNEDPDRLQKKNKKEVVTKKSTDLFDMMQPHLMNQKNNDSSSSDNDVSNTKTNKLGKMLKQHIINRMESAEKQDQQLQEQIIAKALLNKQIYETFKIDVGQIHLLKSNQEKIEYVIQEMNKNVEQNLIKFDHHLQNREKMFQKTESENKKIQYDYKNQSRDMFSFLNIKNKYIALNKKLKLNLIGRMNDIVNQDLISQVIDHNKLIEDPYMMKKIELQNIPHQKTTNILKSMGNDLLDKLQRKKEFSDVQDTNQKQNPYLWSKQKEKTFVSQKSLSKNLFYDEINCSNWNQLGCMPLVQAETLEQRKKESKVILIQKVIDGVQLTDKQYKFLADQSDLLNSCVDKKYVQKAVDNMKSDIIHHIAMEVSEQIIQKYNDIKSSILNSRQKYINSKIISLQQDHKEYYLLKSKQKSIQMNQKEHTIKKRNVLTACTKSEKTFLKKLMNSEDSSQQLNNSLTDQSIQLDNAPTRIDPNDRYKDIKARYHLSQFKFTDKEKKKRFYHPNSKLIYVQNQEIINQDDVLRLNNTNALKQKAISDYNITIRSSNDIKNPQNFLRYYTGGPLKIVKQEPFYNAYQPSIFNATQEDINKIIFIQKMMRGFVYRKRYEKERQFLLENKQILMKNVLEASRKNQKSPCPYFLTLIERYGDSKHQTSKSIQVDNKQFEYEQQRVQALDFLKQRQEKREQLVKHQKILASSRNNNFKSISNSKMKFTSKDVNVQDDSGNTPLYYTFANKNYDFSEFLLSRGALVNIKCENGNTPAFKAFQTNDLNIIMLAINYKADLNVVNNDNQTPLINCSQRILNLLNLVKGTANISKNNIKVNNNDLIYGKNSNKKLDSANFISFKIEIPQGKIPKKQNFLSQSEVHKINQNQLELIKHESNQKKVN